MSFAHSGRQSTHHEFRHERDHDEREKHSNGYRCHGAHAHKIVWCRYDLTVEIIVYTRRNCPLCDVGIAAARSVFGEGNVMLVDVDLELSLLEKYTDRVPVIETSTGQVVDEGVISASSLREFAERSSDL
jgi:hypothetical protein